MKNEYTTHASFDYEAIYQFTSAGDAPNTAVYDNSPTPSVNDWLITKAEFLKNNQETFDTIAAVGVGQLSAIGQASVVESFDNSSVLAGISIAADSRYVLTGVAINYTVTGNTSQALVAAGSSNYVIAPTAPFTVKA